MFSLSCFSVIQRKPDQQVCCKSTMTRLGRRRCRPNPNILPPCAPHPPDRPNFHPPWTSDISRRRLQKSCPAHPTYPLPERETEMGRTSFADEMKIGVIRVMGFSRHYLMRWTNDRHDNFISSSVTQITFIGVGVTHSREAVTNHAQMAWRTRM